VASIYCNAVDGGDDDDDDKKDSDVDTAGTAGIPRQ